MIKIRKPSYLGNKVYKPEFADIFSTKDFIAGKVEKKDIEHPILLSLFGNHIWRVLDRFEIDYKELKEKVKYECYLTGNTYYNFLPFMILCGHGSHAYRGLSTFGKHAYDMHFDEEWTKNQILCLNDDDEEEYWKKPSKIQTSMLGHGYTECTLPSDGSNEIDVCYANLSNGDALAGFIWLWYNK